MPLNHFNTTPATHPELYRDEVYMGRCKQLTPGQSISAEVCARWMAVIAVNYGWNVGDIAIQVALERDGSNGTDGTNRPLCCESEVAL